ncbi:hypothetical protein ACQKWADRAFT_304270 [Trichoderma austrokoningii]
MSEADRPVKLMGSLGAWNDATVLWDFAYDLLQRRSCALLQVYEVIISKYLTEKDTSYKLKNRWFSTAISSKGDSRRRQMDLVIQFWLAEHENGEDVNDNLIEETIARSETSFDRLLKDQDMPLFHGLRHV